MYIFWFNVLGANRRISMRNSQNAESFEDQVGVKQNQVPKLEKNDDQGCIPAPQQHQNLMVITPSLSKSLC